MLKLDSTSHDEVFKSVLVVIPAYNAEKTIGDVVAGIKEVSPHLDVLVIDDGSSDGSGAAAELAGASLVSHNRNMGKGAALRTGFQRFLAGEYAAVITLDADGQHSPGEIPGLIRSWIEDHEDIVVGTRKRSVGTMPLLRIFTNTVSSWLVSLSAGRRIRDSQSGYRLITRPVLERVETDSQGYGAESEILIKAGAMGFRIGSAPITTIYEDEKSYIHPLKQPLLFLGLIFKSLFWRFEGLGRRRPRQDKHSSDQRRWR
jgi:glycosyltransferase involved in cell wall biosynthesis